MNKHQPTSIEAVDLGPARRAAAARLDAETLRWLADEVISHGLRFSDPWYDASWRLRQMYLEQAQVCDAVADTFTAHALAEHIEAVA